MPIAKPSLDSRTFDVLVADSRAKVPRLAPPWTDHNASDPGITLLELLSWLVEQDLFRLDRVPDAEIRAFLRLLRSEPRPATVAWTLLTFGWNGAAPAPVLAAGLQLGPAPDQLTFETTRALVISPASLVQVLQLGADPQPGDALYLGFDQALGPPATRVRLAVLGADPEADAATWAALVAEWAAAARADLVGALLTSAAPRRGCATTRMCRWSGSTTGPTGPGPRCRASRTAPARSPCPAG